MKPSEIRQKSTEELKRALDEANREQFNLRFQAATGSMSNPGRATEVRRDIARIKTILKERELQNTREEA